MVHISRRAIAVIFGAVLLLTVTGFGQVLQNIQWDVPYYDQLTYLNWGQSSCGPTSITGLLKFWFPNSTIDIPEVYHGATQANTYNGPLFWYRNVGWQMTGVWGAPDTGFNRTTVPIPGGRSGFQQYYGPPQDLRSSEMVWDSVASYLRNTWGGTAQPYSEKPLDQLLQALSNGPILASVTEDDSRGHIYGTGHVVLVTGYNMDTQGNEWILFNEPYYPYVSKSAIKPTDYPRSEKNRTVSKSVFDRWYWTNRHNRLKPSYYITFAPPSYYGQASDNGPSDVRKNTIVIDNGSYYLDEVLAVNASVPPSNTFQVDDVNAKDVQGDFIWWLYHASGIDYAYAKQPNRSVKWIPRSLASGWYILRIRSYKRTDSAAVYYSLKQANGQETAGIIVNQQAANSTEHNSPLEAVMGMYYLSPGVYVEVTNMPANTAADAVVFEYVNPSCRVTVNSALSNARTIALTSDRYEAEIAQFRLAIDNALATVSSCPVIPTSPLSLTSVSCSPNPTDTNTQISCNLAGSNINRSTLQLAFFGPNCDINVGCSVVSAINGATFSTTNVDFTAKLSSTGSFTLKGRNSSGDTWVAAPQTVTVNAPATAPFTIAPTSGTLPAYQNSMITQSFTLTNNSTTAGSTVSLAQYILENTWPFGLTVYYTSPQTMPPIGQSLTFIVTYVVSAAMTARSYPMELRATVGSVTQNGDFALNVAPTSSAPFTLTPSSSTITLADGSSTSLSFTLKNNSANSGSSVSLAHYVMENTWPSGLSDSYPGSVAMPTAGQSTNITLNLSASSSLTARSYPMELRGTVAGLTMLADYSLSVTAGSPPANLSGYCTVNGSTSAQSFTTGTQIIWNANVSGGTDPKNFSWNSLTANNVQSIVLVANAPATYNNVSVVVSDSGNPMQQITLTCPQVTVTAASSLGCGCSLSPNPTSLGSGSTLSASCLGGNPPYQFLLPNGSNYSSTYSTVVMPPSKGTQSYTITGKDSSGNTASGSCALTVN